MKKWTVLIVLYVLLKKCNSQFACDPAIDCSNAEVGDLVPDPENCEYYYVCVLLPPDEVIPTGVPIKCPSGMYFYQGNATCIEETEPCRNICPPENFCDTTCPMPFDVTMPVASKVDCTHFKLCRNESETLLRCSEGSPYFNGLDCVADKTQCCDFCSPFCSQIDLPIQDPCNCNSYYSCPEVGRITEDTISTACDAGEYFDEEKGQCEKGACINICPACRTTVVPSTEITTTDFICIANCDFLGAQIQNPCDCTTFYICNGILGPVPDVAMSIQCPQGQYFDETLGKCIEGSCNNTCPFCDKTTGPAFDTTTEFLTGPPQTDPAILKRKERD